MSWAGECRVPGDLKALGFGATDREARRTDAPRSRLPLWIATAIGVCILGLAAAVVAATGVADEAAQESRHTLETSSAAIASTLRLKIAQEQALIVGVGAFLSEHPDATNAEFGRWVDALQAFGTYPE